MSKEGTPPTDELRAWLRLSHAEGIGPVRAQALLQRLGPPQAILDAGFGTIAEALGSSALAGALLQRNRTRDAAVANALRWLEQDTRTEAWHGSDAPRSLVVLADARYPRRLLDLADPPLLLYCVGDPAWLGRPQIGIVGSRNATALGVSTAQAFAEALAAQGWTVASGMAEGIDRAAHVGALNAAGEGAGTTVAAFGTGIDLVYPSRHRGLAQRIAAHGAVVSEQPIGTPPLAANFPRRNRLIAAMAHAILVVEAAPQSGSLITARLAADLGREVMAVPGSIHSPLARGCNSLIRQGAKLVECAEDIVTELPAICRLGVRSTFRSCSMSSSSSSGMALSASHPAGGQGPSPGCPAPVGPLPETQAQMLSAMSADPVMLETLAARHKLPVANALAALQTLELIGLVQRQLDGSYIRCP